MVSPVHSQSSFLESNSPRASSSTATPPCCPTEGRRIVYVSQTGDAEFKSVQMAINSLSPNGERAIIHVRPGLYLEQVKIPPETGYITISGTNPETTILTWNYTTNTEIEGRKLSTYKCASVIVEGKSFIAENLTFENHAPMARVTPDDSASHLLFRTRLVMETYQLPWGLEYAVALRISGDQGAFYNCRFLGWQATLYLQRGRVYFKDCYIEGSVDFIRGSATALFDHCHIYCKSNGYITAQSPEKGGENDNMKITGFVFLRCVITGSGTGYPYIYLGRPRKRCSKVIYAYTFMDGCIQPAGWAKWSDLDRREETAYYCEYRCTGPGSVQDHRVPWIKILTVDEAQVYLTHHFLDRGHTWLDAEDFTANPPTLHKPLTS